MKIDRIISYRERLIEALDSQSNLQSIGMLGDLLKNSMETRSSVYICGNGGSAGNANHLANDFLFGAGAANGVGLKVESLAANSSVITCLGNDIGYENIFSEQIRIKGQPGDLLIALSGSGNSPNIVKAIKVANELKMHSIGILGFDGGKCKDLVNLLIHFEVCDMQIAEDLQMIVGHLCMKWLAEQNVS